MTRFGTTQGGREVEAITLTAGDLTATVLTYGAIVQELRIAGVPYSLCLGSDNLRDYEDKIPYFGAIVGPIANRISNARVRLDSMMYELERNEDGQTHLHSGSEGVHRAIWTVKESTTASVTLALIMPDGKAGLPGRRAIEVRYQVNAPATLTMTVAAQTDATTCMNFASHIYWNLDDTPTWAGHQLRVAADHYLAVDGRNCPTGELCDVTGTNMDFRAMRMPQIAAPPLDHNFCLSYQPADLRDVVWLQGRSGVCLTVTTTEPGVQIHDASGSHRPGKQPYEGIVIEPQRWPDAPNNLRFPSITLRPDDTYRQTTSWTFVR